MSRWLLPRGNLWRPYVFPRRSPPKVALKTPRRVLINAQIAAPLVAVCPKKRMLVQENAIDPGPFSLCDFRLRQARFHSEKRPMWKGRKLYDLSKATEPPREWFPELLLHAGKIGITIFSSVFSPEDVDFLEQFNPPAYEIASADRAVALWPKSRRAKCIT